MSFLSSVAKGYIKIIKFPWILNSVYIGSLLTHGSWDGLLVKASSDDAPPKVKLVDVRDDNGESISIPTFVDVCLKTLKDISGLSMGVILEQKQQTET